MDKDLMDVLKIEDLNIGVDNTKYKDMFKEINEVDEFKYYLKEAMELDVKRYFTASKEQQDLIKGAFYRTQYLYNLIVKFNTERIKTGIDN